MAESIAQVVEQLDSLRTSQLARLRVVGEYLGRAKRELTLLNHEAEKANALIVEIELLLQQERESAMLPPFITS